MKRERGSTGRFTGSKNKTAETENTPTPSEKVIEEEELPLNSIELDQNQNILETQISIEKDS